MSRSMPGWELTVPMPTKQLFAPRRTSPMKGRSRSLQTCTYIGWDSWMMLSLSIERSLTSSSLTKFTVVEERKSTDG
jgi:hypothetical protein